MGFSPQVYPAFWAYPWVLFGGYLWMGYLLPAALVPSVWLYWRGASSFDPLIGSPYLAALAPNLFPFPTRFPPTYSLASTLGEATSRHCPQVGCRTPASSAPMAVLGGPSRGAPYLKTSKAPPSEWASRFSIWVPLSCCAQSSALCPLPPLKVLSWTPAAPAGPGCSCSQSPCRARCCLFEC